MAKIKADWKGRRLARKTDRMAYEAGYRAGYRGLPSAAELRGPDAKPMYKEGYAKGVKAAQTTTGETFMNESLEDTIELSRVVHDLIGTVGKLADKVAALHDLLDAQITVNNNLDRRLLEQQLQYDNLAAQVKAMASYERVER